jgi:DNA (cytosine-5)-methyltransferase 1
MSLELISLFCGPGGFDEGFRKAKFNTRLAYDIDPISVRTHKRNHPQCESRVADLATIQTKTIADQWNDVMECAPVGVIGGSPCQSFSHSNVHQVREDPRNRLPRHFARILRGLGKYFDINFFVFENVPALASKRHQHILRDLELRLDDAGYSVFKEILDAQDFGVAQQRRRLFLVGINASIYPHISFEFPTSHAKRRNVRDVIGGLPEPIHSSRERNPAIPYHPNHRCMRPVANHFRDRDFDFASRRGRSFRALSWDKPSYTVAYGNREVHVHPDKHRRLSVLEAMLLQGFPKRYVLEGTLSDQIRLISEAVSPPVAKSLGMAIRKQLGLQPVG